MMLFRRLSSLARRRGAAACAVCALTLTASAADATHARTRHAAQSAGVTETHGRLDSAEAATAHRARRHAQPVSDEKQKSKGAAKSPKGSPAAKHSAKNKSERAGATTKRHHRQREIEVEQPIPMSQAAVRHEKQRSGRDELAAKQPDKKRAGKGKAAGAETLSAKNDAPVNAPAATTASRETAQNAAAKKPVTVDDFVRAANGGLLPGETKASATQGVSKPDEDERIETADTPETPAASAPAKPKPAPIARPAQHGAVAARAVVAAADAPAPIPAPAPQVIDGFGAEVAVLPGVSSARGGLSRKNAPPDELASNDKTLQRELADNAMQPVVVPLYTRSGKLITPAPMKGTHEILVHQNLMADQEGLARIQDDNDLNQMRAAHLLLPLPDIDALDINEELPYNRRYARPWTVKFVSDIAHAYYTKFHEPLRLNSAVRTVDFQRRLQRVNGNAAALEGETASPHLTGQAIDFGKSSMTHAEIAWMRAYLGPIMSVGKIDVEEEFQQACFHISVYTSYAPKKKSLRQDVAEVR